MEQAASYSARGKINSGTIRYFPWIGKTWHLAFGLEGCQSKLGLNAARILYYSCRDVPSRAARAIMRDNHGTGRGNQTRAIRSRRPDRRRGHGRSLPCARHSSRSLRCAENPPRSLFLFTRTEKPL